MTPYHCKYWAHALTMKGLAGTMDSIGHSLANARVDLNPHQVEAAIFAINALRNGGALLADEVGLGKTIEAGMVLLQRWAERRRRMLLIVPATLRRQWQQEVAEKFDLPTEILDSTAWHRLESSSAGNPLDQTDRILICSYHFAWNHENDVRNVPWDLVVVDEAHRLRNVYQWGKKIASSIAASVGHCPKLLLTATPIQNSLMELDGLASILDTHIFGSVESFRYQFMTGRPAIERDQELRQRLQPICVRTLRQQVAEYVSFTERIPLTQLFRPLPSEQELYERVLAYLRWPQRQAIRRSNKLMELVLLKLLASSTFATAGTLRNLQRRLENLDSMEEKPASDDYEDLDELEEEWDESDATADAHEAETDCRHEIEYLRQCAELAESIHDNAKGQALVTALEEALRRIQTLGAARKAVIFTESRRTQQYLLDLLSANGFAGEVVTLNGTNEDLRSTAIFGLWVKSHPLFTSATSSRTVDVKTAIVEEFRDRATIMVATEAAAEGVNLQFCSLVINYDLPWNPQRVEQRIGRCHRYGQKYDVVVLNFLNETNLADQKVYELLSSKFRLFQGVFGCTDEILARLSRAWISNVASRNCTGRAARSARSGRHSTPFKSAGRTDSSAHGPDPPRRAGAI